MHGHDMVMVSYAIQPQRTGNSWDRVLPADSTRQPGLLRARHRRTQKPGPAQEPGRCNRSHPALPQPLSLILLGGEGLEKTCLSKRLIENPRERLQNASGKLCATKASAAGSQAKAAGAGQPPPQLPPIPATHSWSRRSGSSHPSATP